MTNAQACRYLSIWQGKYGLNDDAKGTQGLTYVAHHAAGTKMGDYASQMLADTVGGRGGDAAQDEIDWTNYCVRLIHTLPGL